jgi:DNA-binding NarL/FixJ family response regulator
LNAIQQIRVLLVDDHTIVRQALSKLLQVQIDLEIIEQAASDGLIALEVARNTHPDVVVMDVHMPGMGGVEATRRLKSELPGVCVIGLSMFKDEVTMGAMLEAGAAAFLSKDCMLLDLVGAIRGCYAAR